MRRMLEGCARERFGGYVPLQKRRVRPGLFRLKFAVWAIPTFCIPNQRLLKDCYNDPHDVATSYNYFSYMWVLVAGTNSVFAPMILGT